MPPRIAVVVFVGVQHHGSTHGSTVGNRGEGVPEPVVCLLACVRFVKDQGLVLRIKPRHPRVFVGEAPQPEAVEGGLRQRGGDDVVVDLSLGNCSQIGCQLAHPNVHLGNVDPQAEVSEAVDLVFHHARRWHAVAAGPRGVEMGLDATPVDGDTRLYQACQQAIESVGFRLVRAVHSFYLVVVVQQNSGWIRFVGPPETLFDVTGSEFSKENVVRQGAVWCQRLVHDVPYLDTAPKMTHGRKNVSPHLLPYLLGC
mmetsp:Transcript_16289/g.37357  ORF Transcript_16289/g.37357 Transcript_16289/m.37357 type:complete len:255 (-) Transcript_16289:864-1628(-)